MSEQHTAVEARDVSKRYGDVWALREYSAACARGLTGTPSCAGQRTGTPWAPETDHGTNTSGTFTDVNLETRRPGRPVPPMAGTAAIGAVVRLPAAVIEEGRDLSSMSGILAGTA
ncbi:hypothetical protein [Streptomyces mirabilis]|uniref:hypothetical protein n=1 Tax=Streptomyces mirabilis TaxID=68239 RepID=UPI003320FF72